MGKIKVLKNVGGIEDLSLIVPETFSDERGSFTEIYNEKEMKEAGCDAVFVQDNQVFTKEGVIRGFHVNKNHPQAKLIRVVSGKIYDVVIDLRDDSETYGKSFGVYLDGEEMNMLYIPEGFAHAYKAVKDSTVLFKVTTHYIPGDEIFMSPDDKTLNVTWPS